MNKKQIRKFWNRLFGNLTCPYCKKTLTELLGYIDEHGIDLVTYIACQKEKTRNISSCFGQDFLECPHCAEYFEIYYVEGEIELRRT